MKMLSLTSFIDLIRQIHKFLTQSLTSEVIKGFFLSDLDNLVSTNQIAAFR